MQIRSRQSSAAPWKEETNLTNLANLTVVYTDGADALSFVCFIQFKLGFFDHLILPPNSFFTQALQTSLSKLNKLIVPGRFQFHHLPKVMSWWDSSHTLGAPYSLLLELELGQFPLGCLEWFFRPRWCRRTVQMCRYRLRTL